MAKGLRTITVRELMEALEGQDPDMRVVFTCDYGDYHHTPQALAIRGEFEELPLVESAYSHSGFALVQDDEEDEDESDDDLFLVLR